MNTILPLWAEQIPWNSRTAMTTSAIILHHGEHVMTFNFVSNGDISKKLDGFMIATIQ